MYIIEVILLVRCRLQIPSYFDKPACYQIKQFVVIAKQPFNLLTTFHFNQYPTKYGEKILLHSHNATNMRIRTNKKMMRYQDAKKYRISI